MSQDVATLLERDRAHLWHPYSSADAGVPYLVRSAAGVRLRLEDQAGSTHEVIDAMSSWWCAIHGYAVPELDAAARDQLGRMSHVMFGGLTHRPAIDLADRLVELAPHAAGAESPLVRVFFADSGSVAVEVALKMALQYHAGRDRQRRTMLTIRGGYHGDTFGAMSVCDPVGGMHSMFVGVLAEQVFAPQPPPGVDAAEDGEAMRDWARRTRELFARHGDQLAAVILEPVLQGAGGMYAYSPFAVRLLADLAREHGALLILDEIATGFGRTGTIWAADRCGVVPDILCLGKALTGGYLSLAATLCTARVAEAVSAGGSGALMHGPTFMANPLACSIALASLDLLAGYDLPARIGAIEAALRDGLAPARQIEGVRAVRVLGGVGVIELDKPADVPAVTCTAVEHGVWLRPFRNLVYAMPPYVCSRADLDQICRGMLAGVDRATGKGSAPVTVVAGSGASGEPDVSRGGGNRWAGFSTTSHEPPPSAAGSAPHAG